MNQAMRPLLAHTPAQKFLPRPGRYPGMVPTLSFPAALALLALSACDGARRIAEVQNQALFDAAFGAPRLDRAPRLGPAGANVDPRLFGFDTTRTGSPHNNVTFDADICEAGGRQFYFVTRQNTNTHSSLVWLEVGRDQPAQPIDEQIDLPPTRQRLGFDTEAVPGGIVVLYVDGNRVVEVRATITLDGLAFAPARTLATTVNPVLAVQLTKTDDRLHALWTTCDELGDSRADHCSAGLADLEWTPSRRLPARIQYSAARMAAGDHDLYIAWCDNRYRSRKNWFVGYRNTGKVFVIASRDGGLTFTSPVVLNDPGDFDDVAEAVDLVVGRGGLAVYWRQADQASTRDRSRMWCIAAVDFELLRMHRAGKVAGGINGCRFR